MKKLVFGLIAAVVLAFNGNAKNIVFRESELKTIKIDEYFSQPIFRLIEKNDKELYDELISSKIEKVNIDGVKAVFIQLKNGYFLDSSDKMIYTEIDKIKGVALLIDFKNNLKSTILLNKNDNNVFDSVNKENVETKDLFNPDLVNESGISFAARGCKDDVGFALCYTSVMLSAAAIAASDGPLPAMDILAVSYLVTGTATCHRSFC